MRVKTADVRFGASYEAALRLRAIDRRLKMSSSRRAGDDHLVITLQTRSHRRTSSSMPLQLASRALTNLAFPAVCFETICRSLPIASSSRSMITTTQTKTIPSHRSSPISGSYTSARGYARPARKPLDEDQPDPHSSPTSPSSSTEARSTVNAGPSRSRAGGMSDEQKAKWAFPSKINPTPYDILHLSRTASKAEIKRQCWSRFEAGSAWLSYANPRTVNLSRSLS
jgi:hypothetical protein